ncbi:MFS transporter [Promicromonospora iranensis]|uniref:MFS transporter n=1 Tax=Promicromonospora iranensis TaxID=1105144 RepID=UPI0023A9D667|nr:MFS transporter [Promicromonospora iranensis]
MSPAPLTRDRNFVVFWGTQTLSVLGDSFSVIAFPLLMLEATGSLVQMGLLTSVMAAGSLSMGLVGGAVVDRFDRRRLLIACDVARLLLFAAVPVCWAFEPQVWLLFVVAGVASVFGQLFQITYITAVPTIVGRERVADANSKLQATASLASIGGPALAGLIAATVGVTAAIAIDAATFGVSALGLLAVRLSRVAPAASADRPGLGRDLRTGFITGARFLWRHPVLRVLTIFLTVTTFVTYGLTDVIIYQVRHGLGESEDVVGYVMAAAGAGTCLAAVLSARLRRTFGFGACWITAMTLCGLAGVVLALNRDAVVMGAGVFVFWFGLMLAAVCSMSLRQLVTPDPLLGRVTAAFWTIHYSLAPLGAAVLTAAADRFGASGPLLAVAVIYVAVVGVAIFTPIRERNPEDRPAS